MSVEVEVMKKILFIRYFIQENEKNSLSNVELKDGHFMLTPLQVLMINKRMPKGFKLELEENLLKYLDTIKPPAKKTKANVSLVLFIL